MSVSFHGVSPEHVSIPSLQSSEVKQHFLMCPCYQNLAGFQLPGSMLDGPSDEIFNVTLSESHNKLTSFKSQSLTVVFYSERE